jgi:aspartate carbamoyltransferase catalytic subunit
VHSLVLLLALYENVRLLLVAPVGLEMPAELLQELTGRLEVHIATLEQVRRCTSRNKPCG